MAWCNAPGVRLALPASAPTRTISHRTVRMRQFALGLVVLSLGACDFPTEPPIFESRFVVPAEETSLSINELLPSSVSVAGSEFTLAIRDTLFSRSLAELCGVNCALIPPGTTVPIKPAFTAQVPFDLRLPAEVSNATIAGGRIRLELTHNFGFDPLANGGYIKTVLTNNGRTVAVDSVAGPFAGGTLTRDLTVAAGEVTGTLTGTITLVSPQGGSVTYQPTRSLDVRIRPGVPDPIRIASATVAVPSNNVNVEQVELDLSDIDESMAERVERGTIVLRMTNPFNVSGTLQMTFAGANVAPKQITVTACTAATPCTTTQRIDFNKAEMQALLGRVVTMSITGRLNSGFFTVRPNQSIIIDTDLDMTLRIGGSDD